MRLSRQRVFGDGFYCDLLDFLKPLFGPRFTRNELLSIEFLRHLQEIQKVFDVRVVPKFFFETRI